MDWMAIFTMVIEAIMKCMENRSRASIAAGLADPGAAEVGQLRIILRKKGYRGQALREKIDEGIAWVKSQPEAVSDLMDEAEERVQAAAAADI